jgi:Tfp pilus assembly protein PilE
MGQQQLLLIILGVIVVGIAVAVGITMFSDSAISANRDAVTNDLVNLASRAQQFYRRPISLGGGGQSFVLLTQANFNKLTNKPFNGNGSYSIYTAGTSGSGTAAVVVLEGTGTEQNGGLPVRVRAWVYPDSVGVAVQN